MKKICYIILILCFSLVSCAPTENVIDDGTQANTTDLNDYENVLNSLDEEQIGKLPQNIKCVVNDKLNIDSEINIWDATSYYVKSGKVKAINFSENKDKCYDLMEKLAKAINLNKDVCVQSHRSENGNEIYLWDNNYTQDSIAIRNDSALAETHDGKLAVSASKFGTYYSPFNDKDKFRTDKQLMFMSAEEAEELAVKTAKELEINVCEKNELYVLDDKNTLIFPEDDTDKQNDTYVFFMFPDVYGIPYSRCPENEALTGYANKENHLVIAMDEKGISFLDIPPLYDWVETTETGEILHPSSILSKEVDKLKKYVTSGDIEVSEISLEYMLFADKNETYDIKPVWVVYYYQNQLVTGENSYTQKMALYDVYDAYTGEEYRIQ